MNFTRLTKARALTMTIASLFLAAPVRAAVVTWDGGGADDNVSTGANWNPNGVPTSDILNTTLQFGGAVRLTPNFNTAFSAKEIVFLSTADAFVLGGSTITIGSFGIGNADTQTQNIGNNVTLGPSGTVFSALNGNMVFSGTVALGANPLEVTGVNTTTLGGGITGTGTISKSDATGILAIASTATAIGADLNLTAGITRIAPGGGTQVFGSTSTIAVSGTGTLNFNESTTLDGALLTMASGTAVNVAVGKTLTIQNGADFTVTGAFTNATASTITVTGAGSTLTTTGTLSLNGGSTTNILAGGSVSTGAFGITIGSAGTGTVTVDGSGSSISGGPLDIGVSGNTGSLTLTNGSTGAFSTQISLGNFGAGGNATLNIQSGATFTAPGINLAANVFAATGIVTITGTNSALTFSGAGPSTIGAASLSTATLNVQSGGTFNSGTGAITVNATGTVAIAGGTFNANGDMTLNGGSLTRTSTGGFNLASSKTLTVQAGGVASFFNFLNVQNFFGSNVVVTGTGSAVTTTATDLNFNAGATIQISAGGHVDSARGISIGNTSAGLNTLTVDGTGSQISAATQSDWGAFGGVANATFSNNAVGSFGVMLLGSGNVVGSTATVLVQSGADITSGAISLAADPTASMTGTITVTGAGSTWTVNGTNTLTVGAASNSTATLNVSNTGVFTTGTGLTTVNATGRININGGGVFYANGDMLLNGTGAQLNWDAPGVFALAAGKTLTVQNGADFTVTGAFTNSTASAITVTGAGSTFTTTSSLTLLGGSMMNIQAGGSVSTGAGIINLSGASGNGTVSVGGSGSSLSGGALTVGQSGATGSLSFANGSTGTFATTAVGNSVSAGTSGTVSIQSGATVTAGTLFNLATSVGTSTGIVNITGVNSALTVSGGGATNIGAASLSTATMNVQNGGTFTSGTGVVSLNSTGTINIDGGTVSLLGPLSRNGGVLNFNTGALGIVDNFTVGTGGLLGTDVTFDTTRRFTTTATTTIDAFHTLTLNGATFSTGALVNNGTLAFNSGTLAITGAGGFNIGTGALGGNVTLGTGANLQVTGTTTVASGALLRVDGGGFSGAAITNSGTIDHRDGTLNFTGTLTNSAAGRVFVSGLASPSGAITNVGTITLQNGVGFLGGAGAITNTGLINGDGTIAKPVTNSGAGELRAEAGKTLTLTGTNGTNTGRINLQGGTLDFRQAITNGPTGTVQGRGALNFAGGLTNQGAMNFSAGTTDVFGNINMTGGSGGSARVIASGGGTTTFYNNFTHNGAEVRASDNSTIVFFGAVNGAGPLTGNGTISLEGSYNPGNSPAVVSIGVNFTYGSSSTQIMEIFGTQPGPNHPGPEDGYDKLIFTSAGNPQVRWNGTLEIDLGNNFQPQAGMVFDLFDFDNTRDQGTFSSIIVNDPGTLLDPGLTFNYSNLYVDGTVSVVPTPEPTSALLLMLGGVSLACRRRSRVGIRPRF